MEQETRKRRASGAATLSQQQQQQRDFDDDDDAIPDPLLPKQVQVLANRSNSAGSTEEPPPAAKITLKLVLLVVALIATRSIDQAIYYRIAYEMDNYTWYFSAFILPIGFLVILWPIVWYKSFWSKSIPPESRSWGIHKVLVRLGILDTLFNLTSTFPVRAIGGTASVVLSQAVIPFQMVLNFLLLGNSFHKTHYLGAILAIYGVLVRMIPRLDGTANSADDGAHANGVAYAGWSLVMIASCIPNAFSNAYKEVVLKKLGDLDEFYMNAWVGFWQLLFGLVLIPTVGLPFTADYVPLNELGDYIKDANSCFFGHAPKPDSECGSGENGVAPIWLFFFFICFNITYNMLMLFIFRQGSSVLFVVASTVRLPIVDLLLMWRFVSGPAYSKFSLFDGFALFALALGIITYQSEPEIPGNGPRIKNIWRSLWDCCRCACFWKYRNCSSYTDTDKLLEGDRNGDDKAQYSSFSDDKDSFYGSTTTQEPSLDPDNSSAAV